MPFASVRHLGTAYCVQAESRESTYSQSGLVDALRDPPQASDQQCSASGAAESGNDRSASRGSQQPGAVKRRIFLLLRLDV